MFKYIFRFFLTTVIFVYSYSAIQAQEARRISFSLYGGAAFFPKDQKNTADLSTRVMGGFKPSPLAGLGIYFRLTKRLYVGENYMFLFNAKTENRKLSSHTLRTALKYYIIADKKFNPYVTGSFNVNMVTLNRDESERLFVPDAANSGNVIGSGIQVDSIYYRERALKLSNMLVLGGSIGAGFDIRLSKRFNIFAEYNLHANLGKGNNLIEQYYFSNQSNFMFHTVSAGLNMKIFKPQKQLLAKLKPEDWRNSKAIDVRGTIIYKNPSKTYEKVLPVEKTDTLENVLEIDPTNEQGTVFFSKNIEIGNYQFMLPKKHRKIIRADLQILNYNRIEIQDDELELEMVEDEGSENILSRDANFAVLLREGFQHEVELTTTAENIMGTMEVEDPNCRVRILLKDQYDSVVAYIDTVGNENKQFNFVDVAPGEYKISFQRIGNECTKTEFRYAFTGAVPYVKRQSNTNEPEDTTASYSIVGNVSLSPAKKEAPKGTVAKLIDPSGCVEASTGLGGPKTEFNYKNLPSSDYSAIYEDPTEKASLSYAVKDRKTNVIRQVKMGPPKKSAPKGDILVKGKVELPNPAQASTVSVLLVDSVGRVKQKAPVQPDGTFAFDNLAKNKYRVVYESTDPLLRGKLKYNSVDKSLKINKIALPELTAYIEEADTIHYSKKGVEVVDTIRRPVVNNTNITPKDTANEANTNVVTNNATIATDSTKATNTVSTSDPVKKIPKTKEVPVRYPFTQFKPGTTYNDLGYEVKPEGYGVQISSFFINSNLEKFCQRVRAKGEKSIFIQVIYKDKNNPDAGLIYRVILGADGDKEKMMKKVPAYMDKGYDAVLRKHLTVPVP